MNFDPKKLYEEFGDFSVDINAERCERDFSVFLRNAWSSVDSAQYMHNWHIDAIADHLMALIDGDIRKLLITIPPRCAKTMSAAIAFPAWVWAQRPNPRYPLRGPAAQFLCVAYNTIRAQEDAVTSRRLIASPWYQQRWGSRVIIAKDRDNAERFDTSVGGSRISTGIEATVLGRGGNIKIIDDAMKPDEPESELVRNNVMRTYDEVLSSRENDPRIACELVIAQRLAEFDLPGHVLTKYGSDPDRGGFCHLCYDDQTEVLTKRGWLLFRDLTDEDDVMAVSPKTLIGEWQRPTARQRFQHIGEMIHYKSNSTDLMVTPDHRMVFKDENDWACKVDRPSRPFAGRKQNWRVKAASQLPHHFFIPAAINWQSGQPYVEFGGLTWSADNFADFMGWYLSEGCASKSSVRIVQKEGPNADEIDLVLNASPLHVSRKRNSPTMVVWYLSSVPIRRPGVRVKNLTTQRLRFANAMSALGDSHSKYVPREVLDLPTASLKRFLIAFMKGDGCIAGRNGRGMSMASRSERLIDGLQECSAKVGWASTKKMYLNDHRIFNNHEIPVAPMYYLYVRSARDQSEDRKWYSKIGPQNISRAQYDGEVFCVSVPTTAILVRRNGRVAVSGNCIPARYEWQRHCVTVLGWQDPRGSFVNDEGDTETLPPQERKKHDGESFWANRFTDAVLDQRATAEGPFSWCTPGESPVLMADLDFKPIGAIQPGDMVAGFTMDTKGENGLSCKRKRLVPTRVKSISKSVQQVVKITLESGEVIRCTPDHRWYNRKPDKTHSAYNRAKVGRELWRVSPPRHYALDTEAKRWAAAWLCGFYEGEGSVTNAPRTMVGHSRVQALITFAQGCEQNLQVCEALEANLKILGFDYGVHERQPDNAKWQRRRNYNLRGASLPLMQKFVHVIKAQKWRDRMIAGAFGAHFITGKEKVIRIEPDGVETVYGLETETGNYVVWGLASANSSKYQQAPVPRGGGIIKAEWWQLWRRESFPSCKMVLVSVDTAHTDKEQNDESGITVWGIFDATDDMDDFEGKVGQPLLILRDSWEGRLEFSRLVGKIAEMCKKHEADVCLIEGKANGIDVINEIRRLHGRREWSTIQFDPKGDKAARLLSVQALFSGEYRTDPVTNVSDWHGGIVYAPDKDYAQLVVDRVSAFTGGKMRALALIDTTSQALLWLRTQGHLITPEEHEADLEEELRYKPQKKPVYDV